MTMTRTLKGIYKFKFTNSIQDYIEDASKLLIFSSDAIFDDIGIFTKSQQLIPHGC